MSSAALRIPDEDEARLRIAPPDLERVLDQLQRELDAVRGELEALRRRDADISRYVRQLDEELKLAGRVQQDFLPRSLPQIGPVQFHTLFRPAGHVSGDLYDVMRLDEFHVGLYLADAVGHGMPAALLTMFLKQALVTKSIDASGYRLLTPARTMAKLNDALVGQNLSQATFATALYGHLHVGTLRFTFSKGGHPSPILIPRDGEIRALEAEGALLGVFKDDEFEETMVQLCPGDRVFLYSDGVETAFSDDPSPDAAPWQQALRQRRAMPTGELLRELAEQVDRLVAANPARTRDDLTVIVAEVTA